MNKLVYWLRGPTPSPFGEILGFTPIPASRMSLRQILLQPYMPLLFLLSCCTQFPGSCHCYSLLSCCTQFPGSCHCYSLLSCCTQFPGSCHCYSLLSCCTQFPGSCPLLSRSLFSIMCTCNFCEDCEQTLRPFPLNYTLPLSWSF